ncbi:MAG: hypothetical protein F6K17_14150 [Okeania sp. SIO3C4]|nr:hypothetical protein [Okeania sp. SIO3C4]
MKNCQYFTTYFSILSRLLVGRSLFSVISYQLSVIRKNDRSFLYKKSVGGA